MARFQQDGDYESPVVSFLELMFNLMVLNVLWVICSLPVVTIGVSTAALDYTCIKMRNDEGNSVVRMFFHSFAQNIRQGAILGTGMIAVLIILTAFLIQAAGSAAAGQAFYAFAAVIVMILIFAWMLLFIYLFMVLSRFENTAFRTLTNAVYLIIRDPGRALKVFGIAVMMLIILPYFLFSFFPYGFPMVTFFGIPATAWLLSKHFNQLFDSVIAEQAG